MTSNRQLEENIQPGEQKAAARPVSPTATAPESKTPQPASTDPSRPSSSISERVGRGELRCHGKRRSPRVELEFNRPDLQVRLASRADLLRMTRAPQIEIDGQPVHPLTDWNVVGWYSDDQLDYLELETELEPDLLLYRQCVLSKPDRFLYLADSVRAPQAVQIDYRQELELEHGITAVPEAENSEVYLQDSTGICALLLPLALSEWQAGCRDQRLAIDGRRLLLTHSLHGRALHAPLWFELKPERALKPRTWRQLTVGESLAVVPRDVAVAYRVQVGRRQWVLYQALTSIASRTFLGENHHCEFFLGRFRKKGVEELISVEPEGAESA